MKELIAHARELAASETLVIGNDVRETLTRLADALGKIVCCKDCKFAQMTFDGECKYCMELSRQGIDHDALYWGGDHFCGFGERKEK